MMRHKLLNALLIASLSAMTATVTAQTIAPAQNNTPRNAPVGTTSAPPAGTTSGGMMAPNDSTMKAPGAATTTGARAACDSQPMDSRERCRTTLNTRYSAVAPKCQKLSGSALDDCLKGADTGQ